MEATWIPDEETMAASNMRWLMGEAGVDDVCALHRWSVEDRKRFWETVVNRLEIVWSEPPSVISSGDPQHTSWFPDGRLNIVRSTLRGDPDAAAVIHRRRGGVETVTRGDLGDMVNRAANGLTRFGDQPRIAIAMPMTLEAVVAYLATVAIGGAVVSIADSFAPDEIGRRLRIAGANAVVTQDVMDWAGRSLPMYEKVRAATDLPTVMVETGAALVPDDGDVAWDELVSDDTVFEPLVVDADHISNILFSSGTTGDPKAIPWTHLTPIKSAMDAHFHHDVHEGDVVAWPTNLGWMMGPWLIYASLINGAALALHDDAPTGPDFCRFVAEAGVTMLGVVPSLVREWRRSDAVAGVDWSAIRVFSSTGEASIPEDMDWLMRVPGRGDGSTRPVIEYCGGTEIGGGYIVGSVLQPAIAGTFSMPTLGLDLRIIGDDGEQGDKGALYLVPPSVGLSDRLLNRDHDEIYHGDLPTTDVPLRRHGDQMERLPNGHHRARGRSDDTMNLGGIKVSSAELEETVTGVSGVLEVAAVAVPPDGGGPDQLAVFVVAEPGVAVDPAATRAAMQTEIRSHLNPLFKIAELRVVESLPRTASNKVIRRVLRDEVERK